MSKPGIIHEIGDYGVFQELDEKNKKIYEEQQRQQQQRNQQTLHEQRDNK